MKLSQMKFEDIVIGQRVQSDTHSTQGAVEGKRINYFAQDLFREEVIILWDDHKESSLAWHMWCDEITIIEETK